MYVCPSILTKSVSALEVNELWDVLGLVVVGDVVAGGVSVVHPSRENKSSADKTNAVIFFISHASFCLSFYSYHTMIPYK